MKVYKYKLKPNKAFIAKCENALDICREIYNAALQERRDAWRMAKKNVTYFDQCRGLTEIRQIREDVKGVCMKIERSALDRLSKTFQSYFRRLKKGETAGYPRFKGKNRYNSFTVMGPESFKLKGNKLTITKLGSCRLRLHRPIEGKMKTCSIKREAAGWFVAFAVEENQSLYIPKTGDVVGVDVGLENFATLSTGEVIENPRYYRQAERQLKIAHRKASKKKLRSSNRKRANRILSKLYLKIRNQRRDFFHKLSHDLVREFDEIAVEDLNIKGLSKSRNLAKSINDASWGTFIRILCDKAASAGRKVWKVPAAFTSQDCSQCGDRVKKSLSVREHRCIACGFVVHRDHNAALNIKARIAPVWMKEVTLSDEARTLL